MQEIVYPLAFSTFGEEERRVILEVFDSDRFTMGERVERFEKEFSEFFGKKYAVMTNSGSSANLIGVASLFYRKENPLKPGDEVIVPAISWATTYYPLAQYGLRLIFVDVDMETLNYNVDLIEEAITEKTKMIVTVSVLGNPNYYDKIAEICRKYDLILFDDNCESMGARYMGRYTGTWGLINTFSTFFTHHISTMEGGMILTDDYEIYCILKALRSHGWTRNQPPDSPIFEKKKDDFLEAYRFILPGYNVRPTEIQGALGSVQLRKLPEFLKIRRQNAEFFKSLFDQDERFLLQKEVGESSYFSFTLVIHPESGLKREKVFEKLRSKGIEFRMVTGGCFLEHDVIKYFDYDTVDECKNARYVHYNGFFVGNGPVDLRKQIEYLYKVLKEV